MTSASGETAAGRAVTIGLPLYNDSRYLAKTLDSLLAQTFGDFEIVISDNASTDESAVICAEYVRRDNRIRYVRQPHNLGVHANFLFVLHEARSEFFMWAASDDNWHPDFLSQCIGGLRRDPGCAVAFGPFVYMDEDGKVFGGVYNFDYSGSTPLRRLLHLNCNFDAGRDSFWYGLYRRDLIKDVRIRRWWWINASIYEKLAYPVLSHVLARGNYAHVGKEPIWHNRVHWRSKPRHSSDFNHKPILAVFAFVLRQINVASYSFSEILRARESVPLALAAVPILFLRCCADIVIGLAFFVRLTSRKIFGFTKRTSVKTSQK